jgi:hypothetical protein
LKEAEGEAGEDFIDDSKDNENTNEKTKKLNADQLLSGEQAILQSIDSCSELTIAIIMYTISFKITTLFVYIGSS